MSKNRMAIAVAAAIFLLAVVPVGASSHREALAVLNEPCADTTDVYAWVSPGDHGKLYLIANFLPLHEPGQGNQGLRACDNYRYEFHVGMGASLEDVMVYRVEFSKSAPTDVHPSVDTPLGGNEILWQLTGASETYEITKVTFNDDGTRDTTRLGRGLATAPNNHGPQTDRLAFGLGPYEGYESGDPTSRTDGLYNNKFARSFVHRLANGGRAFAGQRDDPFYLDEKGIFDLVNLCADGLFGIPGARTTPCEDVFAGFNVFTIALEIPTSDFFPGGIPHNGTLDADSTDSLLRIWFGVRRRANEIVDPSNVVTGYRYEGEWMQVGRQALPLINAGLVGVSRQTAYLRSTPSTDVSLIGADILFPILVRDAELLGIYAALGLDAATIAFLKGPRLDIIETINLGRPIPIADGFTGDVITLDAAIDSQFPNGRSLIGDFKNAEQVDVSDVIISLVVAGDPGAGAGDGVHANDKNMLQGFPWVPKPHEGLSEGHGAESPALKPK